MDWVMEWPSVWMINLCGNLALAWWQEPEWNLTQKNTAKSPE
jgi:hypothetical protein